MVDAVFYIDVEYCIETRAIHELSQLTSTRHDFPYPILSPCSIESKLLLS